jgi:S-adenosylmethionine synthetase
VERLVRKKIVDIGYNSAEIGYNGNTVEVLNKMNTQSSEIAGAVVKDNGELGAGDQGMMFGFACDETPEYMPLAHSLSFRIINLLQGARKYNSFLLPDAKSQVTVEYGETTKVHTVLVSTQHQGTLDDLRKFIGTLLCDNLPPFGKIFINPSGEWRFGGPAADTGLSGRKIVVDNYGSDCPIGGGSFSGKDPTKVDRSGAYAARHIAKNIVASGLAKKAQVQVSYAIGVAEPLSLRVCTFGTSKLTDEKLTDFVREKVSLSPKAIIDRFGLRRPIYAATASGGHFGRQGFPWEELTLVSMLKNLI